jgi:hypothetical protein
LVKTKDGGLGGAWALQRNDAGRLEELPESHRMQVPDGRGDWGHREGQQQRRARR